MAVKLYKPTIKIRLIEGWRNVPVSVRGEIWSYTPSSGLARNDEPGSIK